MTETAKLLILGDVKNTLNQNIPNVKFEKCSYLEQLPEIVISNDYQLLIMPFSIENTNIIDLNDTIQSLITQSNKNTKLLVITNTSEEEKQCENMGIMYYPAKFPIKTLLLQILDKLHEPQQSNNLAIINFKELFIRVDNNRKFIKNIIDQFLLVKNDRLSDIERAFAEENYTIVKNSAHKLKGVLSNFAMQKAAKSAADLENMLKNNSLHTDIEDKIKELTNNINEAIEFYLKNKSIFDEK